MARNLVRIKYAMKRWALEHGVKRPDGFKPGVRGWGKPAKRFAWRITKAAGVKPSTKPDAVADVVLPPSVGSRIVSSMAKDIGTTESPAGSNWGTKVRAYLGSAGFSVPAPWCAAFRAYHQRNVLPTVPLPKLAAYVGPGGWATAHTQYPQHYQKVSRILLKRGDYVCLWGNQHIETFVRWIVPGVLFEAIGGNTSVVGKNANGGMVCRTRRSVSDVNVAGRVRA